MQEIEVPPRDTFAHYIYVDQPGRNLLWWFNTKRHNIGFGLYYRPGRVEGTPVQAELKPEATDADAGSTLGALESPRLYQHHGASRSASLLPPTRAADHGDAGDASRQGAPILRSKGSRQMLFTEEPAGDTASLLIPSPTPSPSGRGRRQSTVGAIASNLFGGGSSRTSSPASESASGPRLVSSAAAQLPHSRNVSVSSDITVSSSAPVTAAHTPMLVSHTPSASLSGTNAPSRTASPAPSIRSISTSAAVAPGLMASAAMSPTTQGSKGRQRITYRPKDPRMKELMPVEVYESSKRTVQGQLEATEEGTYIFIFGKPMTTRSHGIRPSG
ncbi:hypothetical protein THASP1DRAFT_32750 [Thamnocephalis sphaerospora]|uniref:GOLD domain-containing protein n=1 Tax=Thamnocephalis sphaerospora TaxID=78915 RepID=A0A4P9XI99_9FUNG|nr:hypothetical protein THASP1DRAFT_32750 [Thamnocephalis sphaerospora]|eukprot:RKP05407.1 hypothetical protein THASP1DRAFT_32750 [Thamnocephalis sphaerospora]